MSRNVRIGMLVRDGETSDIMTEDRRNGRDEVI
jgi:hypothetical protein